MKNIHYCLFVGDSLQFTCMNFSNLKIGIKMYKKRLYTFRVIKHSILIDPPFTDTITKLEFNPPYLNTNEDFEKFIR